MHTTSASTQPHHQPHEQLHFSTVLKSFHDYLPYCLSANDARRRSYFSLARAHQQLLCDVGGSLPLPQLEEAEAETQTAETQTERGGGFRERLDEVDDRIRRNADLLSLIADESRGFLGAELDQVQHTTVEEVQTHDAKHGGGGGRGAPKRTRISGHEIDKIQSTLKQFVRDWSREGKRERDAIYTPLLEAVANRYAHVSMEQRRDVRILVPGAGLGRLAFEYASQGYSCQANEFSFYMLLASHYILNKSNKVCQHTIYPFVHSSSNWRSAHDMLRPIRIPDILPSSLAPTSEFSMVAGEFCQVYSKPDERHAWTIVATCFFIDTANNILRYLETLNHVLVVGGHWMNAGPLLWHFENSTNLRGSHSTHSMSIELTLEELVHVLPKMGFQIEERRELPPMAYTGMLNGMLQYHYSPEFFVCRKVRDIERAPAV